MEPINIKTKTKYAYDEIKKQIIDGKLNKGSRLIIQDLANELNISSTPVREALAKLESEGLIENQPHVGAIVTGLDVQRIREITIIRSELEHFAIRNLPRENLNEITLRLHDILEKMKAAGAKVDALDCLKLAEEAGSSKAVNIVLMGRLSHYFELPEEAWHKSLEAMVPPKFLELNKRAFERGKNA